MRHQQQTLHPLSPIMSGSCCTTNALYKELSQFCNSDSLSESGLREILDKYGCELNDNLDIDKYEFFVVACYNKLVTEGIIRCLLEYFPRAGSASIDGMTPLHVILCANKNVTLDMVELLVDVYPESPRIVASETIPNPLRFLCNGETLLDDEHATIALDILGLFLERCPEAVRDADEEGILPIHIASARRSPEFCRMLIEAYPGSERAPTSQGALPLHVACGHGSVAVAKYLYKLYPESINVATRKGRKGVYPIHKAIASVNSETPAKAIEMVQFLLDCDPNVASQKFGGILSPLIVVCKATDISNNNANKLNASLKIFKLLYDTHPEAIEDNIITQFSSRPPEEMQTFINTQLTYFRAARDRTFMSTRVHGEFPLHSALCDNATLGSIKLLVQGDRDAVLYTDYEDDALPLHLAVQHHDSTKVVDYLIGLDPNTLTAVNWDGNTALHLACLCAKHDTIALLLEKYNAVSVSKTNVNNKLPIHLLFESNAVTDSEEDIKYTESIFRLLRAYPDTCNHMRR